ncbi:MAG: alpha amylase [Clostridia bacterium]|nr:alpha amylase [Clostridia bacterium]
MKKIAVLILIALLITMTCSLVACEEEELPNDNYRVFYQIFVGSFSDSNGDGIGDLRGIINRFDYLNDGNVESTTSLGVEGIWLSPIFKSPTYHKYDVIDYYQIDPKFGTMEDLEELIELCHSRNVKLILDLVLNHTSNQHQYFKKFVAAHQQGNTEDPYYNYYTYGTAKELAGKKPYLIAGTDYFYEGNFSSEMPEPNFDNPQVRQDAVDVAKFYLDKGIDGFRFDAIKYIYYGDTERSAEFWDWYMAQLKALKPDIYCVGECWSSDTEILEYTSALNCFAFQMSAQEGIICTGARLNGKMSTFTGYVSNFLKALKETSSEAMFIPFYSNHDQDRSAGYPTWSNKKMAANLYILCSGSPFIYYGEELGMTGSRGGANTDANRRLAMIWGDGDTVADPEGATYKNQIKETVVIQNDDENSLLNHYRKLISLRIKHPEIARGEYSAMTFPTNTFGGFKVDYQGKTIYILHNVDSEPLTIDLSDKYDYDFHKVLDYIGAGEATLKGSTLTIAGQTSVILR